MEDARRGHVEEKPIAAPAGPLARWLPAKCPAACPQHTLLFERPAMSLRTRKLGPTQRRRKVPEKRDCGKDIQLRADSGELTELVGGLNRSMQHWPG
jgi:hypothetical protein